MAVSKHLLLVLFMVSAVLTAQSDSAYADTELYRWTDSNGRLVHSDRPPPAGVEYETMNVRVGKTETRPKTSVSNQAPAGSSVTPDREELEVIKKNPQICKNARNNVEVLRSAARIRLKSDDGGYKFLSDEQKAEQIRKAEDLISVHCE